MQDQESSPLATHGKQSMVAQAGADGIARPVFFWRSPPKEAPPASLASLRPAVVHAAPPPQTTKQPTRIDRHEFEIWFNESLEQKVLWLCGILLTLVGQTIMVPGLLMQKLAHRQIEKEAMGDSQTSEASQLQLPYFMRKFWLFGGAIYATGHIFCWIALGMSPQSILACLQCWNMVVVMILGPYFLDEEVPNNAFTYCIFLTLACISVVLLGPPPGADQMLTLAELRVDVMQPILLVPVSLALFTFVLLYLTSENCTEHISTSTIYVFCSAVFAWYSATVSKCSSALVDTSIFMQQNQISLGFGFVLFVFAVLAMIQIHFLNMALKHGEAIAVIPLYEGLSMIGQICFGGIVFKEFAHMSDLRFAGFVFSVAIVVTCLVALTNATISLGRPSTSKAKDEKSKEHQQNGS